MTTNNSADYPYPVLYKITIDKYVSAQGNDSTGDGSLNYPYLTVKKALDVIFSLGDYSATKNYAIYLHGIITESANPLMLPFCHLIGDNSLWNLNGNTFTFKPGVWDALTQFCTLSNIDMRGQSFSMLMSGLTAANQRIIYWDNIGLPLTIDVSGPDFNTVHQFNNCYLYEANSFTQISTLNADTVIVNISGGDTPSTINMIDTGFQPGLYLSLCKAGSAINANCLTNGCYITVNQVDCQSLFTAFNIDGVNTIFYCDDSMNVFNFFPASGSPTCYSNTDAQFIIPSFTPSNYTPTAPPLGLSQHAVEQHLKGIDNALGSSGSVQWAPGYIYKCNLTWTNLGSSGHTISIGTGYARDKANSFNFTVASPISLNITSSGAGGLDTGSSTTHTWYYVYLIGDSTSINPTSGVFSISSTSPTLPAGYDKQRCIGMVKTSTIGTGVILSFTQFGFGSERTYYTTNGDSSYIILSGGNATSGAPGTVNATAVMSPLSQQVTLNYTFTPASATNNFFILNAYGASVVSGDVMGQLGNGLITIPTDNIQHFNYYVTSSSDSLNLQGYSYIESLDIL